MGRVLRRGSWASASGFVSVDAVRFAGAGRVTVAVNPPRRSSLAVPAAPPLSISGSPVLAPCLPLHAARKPLYSS
jgi:hypothetical protein